MRSLFALVVAVFLVGGSLSAQEKGGLKYKFNKGDSNRYQVSCVISVNLKGSDESYTSVYGDTPYKMDLKALFENVTTDVEESTGTGTIERRVKNITVNGEYNKQAFKFEWDHKANKDMKEEEVDEIARFFFTWTQKPIVFKVDTDGNVNPEDGAYRRMVNRMGMMMMPLSGEKELKDGKETGAWLTEEELAVPALHDKIHIQLRNELGKSSTKEGKKIIEIKSAPKTKKKTASEHTPIAGMEIDYTTAGELKVDFDQNYRRLNAMKLSLTVKLDGKGAGAGGEELPIKGELKYEESQTLKD